MNLDKAKLKEAVEAWVDQPMVGEPEALSSRRRDYVKHHLDRCIRDLQLLPNPSERGKLLELGSGLYLMTFLVEHLFNYDIEMTQFWDMPDSEYQSLLRSRSTGQERALSFKHFNAEKEAFPYPDNSFDVILNCDFIEHLLCDPVHVLLESHRVLKPGGLVLVSTPNAMRWRNVSWMIRGRNIFDKYCLESAAGRHPREYTPQELAGLFQAVGFQVNHVETEDVVKEQEGGLVAAYSRMSVKLFDLLDALRGKSGPPISRWRKGHIFLVAEKSGEARPAYPDYLFEKAEDSNQLIQAICRPRGSSGG